MKSLQQISAENITKQTLAQLSASDVVQLLEVDKLQDILKYMGQTNLPMVLAALPTPKESLWIKDTTEWFYVAYGSSPIRVFWAIYSGEPRNVRLYDNEKQRVTAVATTAYEVQSAIVPMLRQHNIDEDAITEIVLVVADYFTRKAESDGKRWMTHSNVLGRARTDVLGTNKRARADISTS